MGFLPCVNREDPFTRRVREVYRANVVVAPRAGIDPLDTLAVRSRSVSARGALTHLIDGAVNLPQPEATPTAGLSGTRSTSVDLKLGLDLTAKFLTALGVPVPGAEVSASLWQGATRLNFHVEQVIEHLVDIAELGSAMRGCRLARTPATELFFTRDGTELYLITGTLTTTSFAVHGEAENGQSVQVAVDAIQDLIGTANADVSWTSTRQDAVTFSGSTAVTFAFSAVPCAIDSDGNLIFGLTTNELTFGEQEPRTAVPAPVVDEEGLLVLDQKSAP